jgi:predicted acyl esterase
MRALLAALLVSAAVAGCLSSVRSPDAQASQAMPAVPPGTYSFDRFARVLHPGLLGVLPAEVAYLPSDVDGVDIELTVWRPDTSGPAPVIVDAGPYYEPAGAVPSTRSAGSGGGLASKSGHIERLVDNYVPLGYAVAALSVRGTAGSGGCMDLMGPKEVSDLSQAITWLGEQAWSSGSVGMVGKSYDGSTPWAVAGTGNPHLKTIVPMSGVPDLYELMFRNGTSEVRGPFLLNGLYYSFALREPSPEAGDAGEAQRRVRHTAEGLPCDDHAAGMLAAAYSGATGAQDPMGYWAERNLKPAVEASYGGSILLVQGLQDWNVDPALSIPWIERLNASGVFVHQILGQWGHNYPDDGGLDQANRRWDWAEILLHWFDYWLKGQGTIGDLGPAVQVLDASGQWRTEEHFPPHDAAWTTCNLSAGGKLTTDAPSGGNDLLLPVGTPTPDAPPPPGYSADFVLPPQETDLRISGLPKVHVTVTPAGATGDVAAWLYDVAPDGAETRIGWTMINLRFADGTSEPRDVTPGQPLLLRMEIQPMDAVVPAGHHLLLRVWEYRTDGTSADGPDVQARLPTLPPSPVTLDYGPNVHSVLELPTVQRDGSTGFVPPHN